MRMEVTILHRYTKTQLGTFAVILEAHVEVEPHQAGTLSDHMN